MLILMLSRMLCPNRQSMYDMITQAHLRPYTALPMMLCVSLYSCLSLHFFPFISLHIFSSQC